MKKNKGSMVKLCCHSISFYSPADESNFFHFVKQIKAVRLAEGVGLDIFLHIKNPVSTKSLRDLIGLFQRYKIDPDELKQFKNKKNEALFSHIKK